MNKRIKTYEDLLEHERSLISRLRTQEEVLKKDMVGIKQGLKPFNKALKVVNKMTTRDNTTPIINLGVEFGVDLLVRRFILARAGWFTKILIPFLMKNYSSHIIGEEKREKLVQKLKNLFNAVRPQQEPVPSQDGNAKPADASPAAATPRPEPQAAKE